MIGDTIEVTDKRGVVKVLNLRTTVIVNSSGEEVFIPNKFTASFYENIFSFRRKPVIKSTVFSKY